MAATPLPKIPPPRSEIRPGVWLDGRLGVFFEASGLLAVADLHWGYAESHRHRGNLLPAWGDDDIERRLNDLVASYRPREMLWLGDSLHTLAGRTRAEAYLRAAPVPVILLQGNHDARWPAAQSRSLQRGGFYFHHGDRTPTPDEWPADSVEVVGHHHPAMVWRDGAGLRLKLPALVSSPRRLVLPAFSPWAAGSPWTPNESEETLWAISARRIFALPARKALAS